MLRRFAAAILALTPIAPAWAGTVAIWPVDPVLTGTQSATALWLENKGAGPVTLQVRALAWSQASGRDEMADQDDVVVSPPFARVGPGERQLVRVIRRAPRPITAEQSYRLLVDELPAPSSASDEASASARLAVQMRYSIPLFITPATGSPKPALVARIQRIATGRILVIRNLGTVHARLTDLRAAATPTDPARGQLLGYVLPGATMTWPLPPGAEMIGLRVNGVEQTLSPAA